MAKAAEIKDEQNYFDKAWDARERKRQNLKGAHLAAGGNNKGMAAVGRAANKELEKLGGTDDAVAFGRFDLDGEPMYIGNHVISTDDRDLLVINWQAPAAERFYQATVQDALGLSRKRTFLTDRNTVTDFDDIVFADIAARLEELTGAEQWGVDDAVLKDLDADRTGEMRDIVKTIHASQDQLIRKPLNRLLLIQGGPGTGKTALALHRISWLLFNHQDTLAPRDCLVIGPNPTFTRYIKAVLPGLGDGDVAYRDLRSLGPQGSHALAESTELARMKGELRMAGLLRTGLSQRVRFPERAATLEVGTGTGVPSFNRDEVEAELAKQLRQSNYNAGRQGFRSFLTAQSALRAPRGPQPSSQAIDNAVERVWPSLTPQSCLRDLLGSRDRLLSAAGEEFTAADVNRLQRSPSEKVSDQPWSDSDVALLDELDELINGRGPTYAHIIVDEAQDLSPLQLRSVKRRSRTGSMTVVGDLAQSTGAWARDSWEDLAANLSGDAEVETAELTLGYRVPRQVYEFAAELLPYAAPEVSAPRVVRDGPADPDLIEVTSDGLAAQAVSAASQHAGSGRFVGLIAPEHLRDEITAEFKNRDISWADVRAGNLDKSINLSSPRESKGLEFDAVVVVDPTGIVQEAERGYRMLYVVLTRTTKYLTVVHDGVAMPVPSPEATESSPSRLKLQTVETPPGAGENIAATPGVAEVDESSRVRHAPIQPVDSPAHRAPDLGSVLVRAAAASVAEQIKASVAPAQWAALVDQLRRDLEVSQEDLFDRFD